MRRYLLIGIAAVFYYSGFVHLARWWIRRSQQRLIILNYHHASKDNLRRHFSYLKKHYRIVHIDTALDELYASNTENTQKHTKRLTPLAITFDDGYQDNYMDAFPLAVELHIPFTIYIIPGYVESGTHFWWEAGKYLVAQTTISNATLDTRSYDLKKDDDRVSFATAIDRHVRYAPSVMEREKFLASLHSTLAVSSTPLAEQASTLPLTWEQVKEMDASGWVSFGAHTMHHPILAYLTDYNEMRQEVEECRIVLEQQLGHPVYSFAYPVGQMQHIGNEVRNAVCKAGFKWAVTTNYGLNDPGSDRYLLRRIEVDVDQHWLLVAAEAAGLWGFFSRLRWMPFIRKYLTNSK